MDPVKLQAQLVKLQSQCDETVKDRDALQKLVDRLKDQNRRGDAELRKAEGVTALRRFHCTDCTPDRLPPYLCPRVQRLF